MGSVRKVYDAVIGGRSDVNIRFTDLCRLLYAAGFVSRVKGGHYIFIREGVVEIINLQPLPGGKAKPYQVRQVRELLGFYGLMIGNQHEV